MTNIKIRNAMFSKGMAQWELAKLLNISESSVWRLLRDELPEKRQQEILEVINNSGEQK